MSGAQGKGPSGGLWGMSRLHGGRGSKQACRVARQEREVVGCTCDDTLEDAPAGHGVTSEGGAAHRRHPCGGGKGRKPDAGPQDGGDRARRKHTAPREQALLEAELAAV